MGIREVRSIEWLLIECSNAQVRRLNLKVDVDFSYCTW